MSGFLVVLWGFGVVFLVEEWCCLLCSLLTHSGFYNAGSQICQVSCHAAVGIFTTCKTWFSWQDFLHQRSCKWSIWTKKKSEIYTGNVCLIFITLIQNDHCLFLREQPRTWPHIYIYSFNTNNSEELFMRPNGPKI